MLSPRRISRRIVELFSSYGVKENDTERCFELIRSGEISATRRHTDDAFNLDFDEPRLISSIFRQRPKTADEKTQGPPAQHRKPPKKPVLCQSI